jgi:hypothetical protein
VKIRSVTTNNRRRAFEVSTTRGHHLFPYAKAAPRPTPSNRVVRVRVDPELGREGFTYVLAKGQQGSIHVDAVLEYNRDPAHERDLMLYRLTLEAQRRVAASSLSKREIVRRLGTSATQFYRLMDQTNYRKSIDQMLSLLQVLDCDVSLVVRSKRGRRETHAA